jgi:predicted nucleic acid-binding protein
MSGGLTVVLDACVLYPAPLRDLLMQLSAEDLFSAKWTNTIHDEWIESVLKSRPDLKRAQLERTRKLMNEAALDPLVTNYEHLIADLKLPDLNDRHVLAAALQSKASVIITFNLKDFPENILNEYGIEAQHPDDFIMALAETKLGPLLNSVKLVRSRLKNPPTHVSEYLETLAKHRLPQTVFLLREYSELL